jgi:hypothetical protein
MPVKIDSEFGSITLIPEDGSGNVNVTIPRAGLFSNIVDDTTPQLGATLDGQNNNLTNIGTISGSNLQLDLGGLT